MGGRSKAQTMGWRYYMGILMGFARGPLDEMVEIKAGDRTAWKGSVKSNQTIQIQAGELFGGDKAEGGIAGPLDVMFGAPDQPVNPRLAAMVGGLVPAFRGVTTAFFDGQLCAMNKYPKAWMSRWRRALNGWDGGVWYPEKAVISLAGDQVKAMNPAHILFECQTNRDWGRGKDRGLLDQASYRKAADTLFAEGFGLCLKFRVADELDNFEQTVLDHIGATQFLSRSTGLWTLRLIREDYDVATLPVFDEDSGLLGIDEDSITSLDGTANQFVVVWHDPITNTDRRARAKNAGAIRAAGGVITTTKEYPGLPTGDLAGRVAARDCNVSTSAIRKLQVRLDRRAYALNPGDVFCVRSRKRGIERIVLRAGKIDYGTLTQGTIAITALEDVFGLPAAGTSAVQPPNWTPPDRTPRVIATRRLIEAPYRDLAAALSDADLAQLQPETGILAALGMRPSGLQMNYALLSRVGSAPFEERTSGDFCPVATISADIGRGLTSVSVTLVQGVDLDLVEVGSAAMIDDEIFRVDAINAAAGTAVLARGCVDTVPAPHEAGALIWFYENWVAEDTREYVTGETVNVKLLSRTSSATLAENLAPVDSLRMNQRQARPYAPGRVLVCGVAYPTKTYGVLTVSWAHRNRVLQADQLVDSSASSISLEAGTTYTLSIYSGTSLKKSYTGLTGTTWTYPVEDDIAHGLLPVLRIVLFSVRDGLQSWQQHDITIERHGLGFRLGEELGGVAP
ncbi:hypothetical protein [Pseudomonas aeruginosa]|uniref:hypothetical protein n=1 Tax=Pseudomonas aeruginosa TaxID=287 RepID=UPI001495870E|nr:hypothetical protein [Pseudomonas aeruginosa]MBI7079166.1 hypothetical protein [Pseudomonas aeruginosa]